MRVDFPQTNTSPYLGIVSSHGFHFFLSFSFCLVGVLTLEFLGCQSICTSVRHFEHNVVLFTFILLWQRANTYEMHFECFDCNFRVHLVNNNATKRYHIHAYT